MKKGKKVPDLSPFKKGTDKIGSLIEYKETGQNQDVCDCCGGVGFHKDVFDLESLLYLPCPKSFSQ